MRINFLMPEKTSKAYTENAISECGLAILGSLFLATVFAFSGSVSMVLLCLFLAYMNDQNYVKWRGVARANGWFKR